jgi:hemolysin III
MGLRDPVSSASHLLIAIWAIYALLVLIRFTPECRRSSVIVFGLSMILLYAASGVFHGVPFTKTDNPNEFRVFQRIDRSAIFLLIAGSNTPLIAILLSGAWRWWFLCGIWTLALSGAACIWVLAKPPHEGIVVICIGMGLIGFLPAAHYYRAIGWRAMNWAVAGCTLYALGAACELAEWPLLSEYPIRIGSHEVFHLFNAVASVVFFVFIARYVVPFRGASVPGDEAAPTSIASSLPFSLPTDLAPKATRLGDLHL